MPVFYQAIKELTNCLIIWEIDPVRVGPVLKQHFKANGGSGANFKSGMQQYLHLIWEQNAVTNPCGLILNHEKILGIPKHRTQENTSCICTLAWFPSGSGIFA